MTPVVDVDVLVDIPRQPGTADLAAQVRQVRQASRPAPADALCSLFDAELRVSLEAGDAVRAVEAAVALWRRSGELARCHAAVRRVLAATGAACAAGDLPVARANRAAATANLVVSALRVRTPAPPGSPVVLATPESDHHVLALESLAHLLEAAGHRADVIGPVGPRELQEAASGAAAVVLSAHVDGTLLPRLVAAARRAAPTALVAVGGPAACAAGADLRTDSVPALLAALRAGSCRLSEREREVLQCVADGLTNLEAAEALGITPATLKTHLEHVFDKTGTSGRAAAVAVALRSGWVR